jgi:DNA-directed RNA polymerase specialized sigma24 family protein
VKNIDWQHRAQFFALSAELMRRILVDAARSRGSAKRGGGVVKINLDEALAALAKLAPRQAKVVELRYFGGLSEEQAAGVLNTSPRTVRRDWQFAKAWLTRDLTGG